MKHIKLFEDIGDIWLRNMRLNSIREICKKYGIENCTLNSDGSVDVDRSVELKYRKLTELPLKFGIVAGDFYCHENELISLEGSPIEVGGNFWCGHNKLVSLEGGPIRVGGEFICSNNQLTSLKGAPSHIEWNFNCNNNKLISLEGAPSYVGSYFDCNNNKLTSLIGSPIEVGGDFYCNDNNLISFEGYPSRMDGDFICYNNPIFQLFILFPDLKSFMDSLDYGYIRGRDVVKMRFQQALEEFDIKMPKSIPGWKYI
jgi:hypothetical protein